VRASRLVALLLHLQHGGGAATAAELATELEVSVRTVYRDVAALQAAGVPLWTEPGPRGGVRLLDGWRTRLDGLSGDEAGSLFLAGAPGAAAELGLGSILASAQTKLLATLPPELRGRAARVRSRFLLDAPHWFHHDEPLAHLAAVADAVWADRRIVLRYGRSSGVVTRDVEPLGVVLKAGVWYLVAAAAASGRPGDVRTYRVGRDVRTYRVGRIVGVELRDERFERDPTFDLGAWWAASTAAFDREILRATVTARLSPRARRRLGHVTDTAAANAALAAASPPDDEGWVTVELAVESVEVALDQLVALGAGVEGLAPASFRSGLAAAGRAIAARNE